MLYSGTRFVEEGGRWVKVEDAKSLKGKVFEVVYLEKDGNFSLDVVDFNYTSITVRLGSKELGKDIPLRKLKRDGSKNTGDYKKDYYKEIEKRRVFKSEADLQTETFDFSPGDILEFGYNSTTITLRTADTENLEDADVNSANPDTNYGTNDMFNIQQDTTKVRTYIKYNFTKVLNQLPAQRRIDSATLYLFGVSYVEATTWNVYKVSNTVQTNWSEHSITWNNQPCSNTSSAGNPPNTTLCPRSTSWTSPSTDQFYISNEGIRVMVEESVNNSDSNITFLFYTTVNWGDRYYASKEYSSSNFRPYLSVTYTETLSPAYSLNSTDSTKSGQAIRHSLYWTDNANLSGYVFSFDNCTGSFVNDSWVAFSGAGNWSNVTKTVNSTESCTIRWKFYANDTSNNWNESLTYTYLTTDGTPPAINMQNPANTTYGTLWVPLNFTVFDANGVSSCLYELDGANTTLASCQNATITGPPVWVFQENASVSDASQYSFGGGNGDAYLYVNYTKVRGATNNSLWQTKFGDIGSPILQNISLSACWGAFEDAVVLRIYMRNINFGSSDSYIVAQCNNGSAWVTIGANRTGDMSSSGGFVFDSLLTDGDWSTGAFNGGANGWASGSSNPQIFEEALWWEVRALSEGNHSIKVWANDSSNNWNVSGIVFFSIDTAKPSIYFTPPTDTNNSFAGRNWSFVNVSVSDSSGTTAFINWNGSLLGWWMFNDGSGSVAADSSANNNAISCWNGSAGSTVNCGWIAGRFGGGVNIRANASEVLTVANANASIYNPRDGISAGGWFNVSALSYAAPYPALIDKGDNNGYYLYIDPAQTTSTNLHIGLTIANTTDRAFLGFDTTFGVWHHIYFTYSKDDNIVRLYLDGNQVTSASLGGQLNSTPTYNLFFADGNAGSVGGGNNGGYAGYVDDLMLFSRALSPEEINASYDAGVWRLYRNFTNLVDGTYSYTAYAQDSAGNVNSTQTQTLTVDTVAPFVNISIPANLTYPTASISLNYTVSDLNGVSSCLYELTNSSGTFNSSISNCQNVSIMPGVTERNNSVRVWANDSANNWNVSSTVYFTVDTTPPTINIQLPANLTYNTAALTVNFTVFDFGGVSSCQYEISNSSGTFNVSLGNCQNGTLYGVTEGSNSVSVWANDSVNNWNESATVYFTVDTIFPSVYFVTPTGDNSFIGRNWSFVNVSVSDNTSTTAFIDWNHSLAGWWRFNREGGENDTRARDWSGYGNNATLYNFRTGIDNGSSGWTASGKFGAGINFDGTNDYIRMENNFSLRSPNSSSSVSAWFKPASTNSTRDWTTIFSSNCKEWGLVQINSTLYGFLFNNVSDDTRFYANFSGTISTQGLQADRWYHAVLTDDITPGLDNRVLSLYLDGILRNQTAVNLSSYGSYNKKPFFIGADNCFPTTNYNGTIDEIQVWNRPLSPVEINSSYNAGVYRLYYNFTGLSDGTYLYTAYAQDSAGNVNQTGTRTLTVDTIKPGVSFVPPTDVDGLAVSRSYSFVNVSVSDSSNATALLDWNRSLVGWWRFNRESGENDTFVRDWSSYGNNGTIINMSSGVDNGTSGWTSSGKFGSGMSFDGVNDNFQVLNSPSVNFTQDMTISAWVYLKNNTCGWCGIAEKLSNDAGTYYGYRFIFTSSGERLQFLYANSTGSLQVTTTSANSVSADRWIFVVARKSGSQIQIYLDAILNSSSTMNGSTINTNSNNLNIGGNPFNNGYFNGTIDEVRIYNRALSPEEINASYNSGLYHLYHNFTGLSDGNYPYVAYAQDFAGNVNSTQTQTLTIDTTAPFVNISIPANLTYPTAFISLNYSVSDLNGLSSCLYELTNSSGTFNVSISSCQNVSIMSGVTERNNSVRVWANDSANNWNVSSAVWFTVDTTPPTINIQLPANLTYNTQTLTINFTAFDLGGVSSCKYELSNSSGTFNVSLPSCLNGTLYGVTEGSNNLSVWANDSVNNWNESATVYFTVDTVFPSVYFASPTDLNNSFVNRNYTFVNVSVSDNTSANAFIDWNRSLVGWWRFNRESGENDTFVRDWSSYGNNGTLTNMNSGMENGSSGWTRSGKFGDALMFDGVNTSVTVSKTASLNVSGGAFTVSAWIKSRDIPDWSAHTIIGDESAGNYGFLLQYTKTTGTPYFEIWNQSANGFVNVYSSANANTWYYVAATESGANGTLTFYVDGVYVFNAPNFEFRYNFQPFNIGSWIQNERFFNGTIDEVRIWNRALSPEEINASYNSGLYRLYRNFTGLSDGAYIYTAYAQDSAGNVNQTVVQLLTVDTTPPSILIQPSLNSTHTNQTVGLNFTVFDSNGVSSCKYELNGVNSSPFTCQNTTVTAQERNNSIRVWANDSANNWNVSAPVYFVVDTTPPAIGIQSPSAGTYSNPAVPLNFSAFDLGGIDTCTYELGNSSGSFTLPVSGCQNTTLAGVTEGANNVSVWANDTLGWWNRSGLVSFTLDTGAPSVSILLPENGRVYNSVNLTLNYTASDNSGISSCKYEYDGSPNVTLDGCANVSLTNLDQGSHTIRVWANDTQNNWAVSATTFTVDTVAPLVNISIPANQTYPTTLISLNYTVSDLTGVSSCLYELTNGSGTFNASISNCQNVSFVSGITERNNSLRVWANDSANNWNVSSTVYFTVDTTPPTINIQLPANLTYNTASLTINFTAFDLGGVSSCLYEISNSSGTFNVSLNNCQNGTLYGVTEGSNNLSVWANDSVNNWNRSETRYFFLDTTPVSITIQEPTPKTYLTAAIELNYSAGGAAGCMYELTNRSGTFNVSISNCQNVSSMGGVTEGNNSVRVWANDSAGNWNVSAAVSFTVDTLPPSINIQNPVSMIYTTPAIALNFTVYDAGGVSSCLYEITNLTGSYNTSLPGCQNTTIAGITEGSNSVKVLANDSFNHWNASAAVSFTLDTNAPSISIQVPLTGNTYGAVNLSLNYTAGDPNGLSLCEYELDGSANVTLINCANSTLGFLPNGGHTLRLWVNDSLNNWGMALSSFAVDSLGPSIGVQSPANRTYATMLVGLNFTASDPSGLGSCLYELSNSSGTFNTSISSCQNTTLSGVTEGSNLVRVWANDTFGNWNVSSPVNFTVDTTPPSISFSTPTNQVVNDTYVFVNVTSSEVLSSALLEWNGTSNLTMLGSGAVWYYNRTSLGRGNYTFRVYGNDSAGNWNSTALAWVLINNTLTYRFNFSLSNSTGGIIENATVFVYNSSLDAVSNLTFNSSNALLSLAFDGGTRFSIRYSLPAGVVLELTNLTSASNSNVSPQFAASYAGSLPSYTTARSYAVALNDSGLEYHHAGLVLPLSGSVNRILHCTSWNFSAAACLSWESNSTSDYNATLNSTSLSFNASRFDAYLAGYYEAPASPPPSPPPSGGPSGSPSPPPPTMAVVYPPYPLIKVLYILKQDIPNVSVSVAPLSDVPGVLALPRYYAFQILKFNFNDSNVDSATVEFRVNSSWISANDIANVSLMGYDNGNWLKMRTGFVSQPGNKSYYGASINASAFFAIVGEKRSPAVLPPPPAEPPVVENATQPTVQNQTETPVILVTQEDIDELVRRADSVVPQTSRARDVLSLARSKISALRVTFDSGRQEESKGLLDEARALVEEAASLKAISLEGQKSAIFKVVLLLLSIVAGSYAYTLKLNGRKTPEVASSSFRLDRPTLAAIGSAFAVLASGVYAYYVASRSGELASSPLLGGKLSILTFILSLTAVTLGVYAYFQHRSLVKAAPAKSI